VKFPPFFPPLSFPPSFFLVSSEQHFSLFSLPFHCQNRCNDPLFSSFFHPPITAGSGEISRGISSGVVFLLFPFPPLSPLPTRMKGGKIRAPSFLFFSSLLPPVVPTGGEHVDATRLPPLLFSVPRKVLFFPSSLFRPETAANRHVGQFPIPPPFFSLFFSFFFLTTARGEAGVAPPKGFLLFPLFFFFFPFFPIPVCFNATIASF